MSSRIEDLHSLGNLNFNIPKQPIDNNDDLIVINSSNDQIDEEQNPSLIND